MQQLLIQITISTLALKHNIAILKRIKTTFTAVFCDLFGLLLYSAMGHVEILFPSFHDLFESSKKSNRNTYFKSSTFAQKYRSKTKGSTKRTGRTQTIYLGLFQQFDSTFSQSSIRS